MPCTPQKGWTINRFVITYKLQVKSLTPHRYQGKELYVTCEPAALILLKHPNRRLNFRWGFGLLKSFIKMASSSAPINKWVRNWKDYKKCVHRIHAFKIVCMAWYLLKMLALFFWPNCSLVCGRYILIYPQGCDVCNHLSLFLCVANHDKLLPGSIIDLPHIE